MPPGQLSTVIALDAFSKYDATCASRSGNWKVSIIYWPTTESSAIQQSMELVVFMDKVVSE